MVWTKLVFESSRGCLCYIFALLSRLILSYRFSRSFFWEDWVDFWKIRVYWRFKNESWVLMEAFFNNRSIYGCNWRNLYDHLYELVGRCLKHIFFLWLWVTHVVSNKFESFAYGCDDRQSGNNKLKILRAVWLLIVTLIVFEFLWVFHTFTLEFVVDQFLGWIDWQRATGFV